MTREQESFLTRRLSEAVAKQPELVTLKSLLLELRGEFLVAPPKPDPDVPKLLEQGFLTSGPIKLKIMKWSSCHQNLSAVWKAQAHGIVGIATGYALSEDGLWRQHSWGILRDGVLETTAARVKYFGVLLQGKSADNFSEANAP